jgi:hypothetical protein
VRGVLTTHGIKWINYLTKIKWINYHKIKNLKSKITKSSFSVFSVVSVVNKNKIRLVKNKFETFEKILPICTFMP